MKPKFTFCAVLCLVCATVCLADVIGRSVTFSDKARQREIPAEVYLPTQGPVRKLAIISGGYCVAQTAYRFIAADLVGAGYMVVSVQHHLPSDEPLAVSGDLFKLRMPVWNRGVEDLRFVLSEIKHGYPDVDTTRVVLVGHSNGGDICCLYATRYRKDVRCLVTLDHRRMPIPRLRELPVLSIRADEFPADPGVVPTPEEPCGFAIRVVRLKNTKHMDLSDEGSTDTKDTVAKMISEFIEIQPNKATVPTTPSVTPAADAPVAAQL